MNADPRVHPADLIDEAHSMVSFLATVLAETDRQAALGDRALEGLAAILGCIEGNLKAALTGL